jgi:hypothetical protein
MKAEPIPEQLPEESITADRKERIVYFADLGFGGFGQGVESLVACLDIFRYAVWEKPDHPVEQISILVCTDGPEGLHRLNRILATTVEEELEVPAVVDLTGVAPDKEQCAVTLR